MALDTVTKRRSAMGIRGLRLSGFPVADSSIVDTDRRVMCGLYAGIAPQNIPWVFWRETGDSSTTFSTNSGSSNNFVGTNVAGQTWVPVRETRDQ
jgi:hypothetical protein